ncbi:type I-C CRISPR-associated protein Cas7/Csd2 [Sphaerospermopsis sp. LEGE 08334]|jgi:CRISPR-associated protein Csd2|uniref:type I-C CRISPR-associated protein Cas7/Csd2 n=1 Tax=Sphaerospermopsis sp. LEGE 08334 TaxID=1828651 RepID=UPI001881E99A|nr:type I-C CRISPR-associated protein Cas7/Csd2 [Sphaerospermopsis sp. LEGE 08334]MBE9058879.1 type I-C CRISPR-associated protein Cas7/Csd2 [Sphaerospermopsis sp. LEGE 08334]
MTAHLDPTKKHDAILLFDCLDGNPNGDPDAGNQPRIDPQTNQGLVTDACLKRKVRNYVEMLGKDETTPERYKIFVEEGSVLNEKISRAYDAVGLPQKEGTPEQQLQVAKWMQQNFYDLRMFGAVLSTGLKAGQVWGPVQISFSRSIDPVFPQSVSITRCAATEEKEKKDGVKKDNKTMGRKEVLPYGLYRSYVFYNPHLAEKSGCVNERDLDLFWQALIKAWEFDRSSARGFMACRGLYVFTHASKYGNAPVHQLFDKLQIKIKSTVDVPRSFADYQVDLDEVLPDGVTLTKLA